MQGVAVAGSTGQTASNGKRTRQSRKQQLELAQKEDEQAGDRLQACARTCARMMIEEGLRGEKTMVSWYGELIELLSRESGGSIGVEALQWAMKTAFDELNALVDSTLARQKPD